MISIYSSKTQLYRFCFLKFVSHIFDICAECRCRKKGISVLPIFVGDGC